MQRAKILEKLENDDHYYGKFGKQYLSASNIRSLLYFPTEFGKFEKTLPLLEGRYFHTKILEPEKIGTIPVMDMATRNNKAFKQHCLENDLDSYDILLQKEKDHLENLVDSLVSRWDVFDIIYGNNIEYEIPNIMELNGVKFKGKCDILNKNSFYIKVEDDNGNITEVEYPEGAVIDLKTTSNVHKFRHSCREYCYDSQAYIYQKLFNKPMLFVVIDKRTSEVKFAPCSQEFIDSGQHKVEKAIKVFKKFFSDDKTHNISDYIYKEIL